MSLQKEIVWVMAIMGSSWLQIVCIAYDGVYISLGDSFL